MKIICIGRNYAAHAAELDRLVGGGEVCRPEPNWRVGDGEVCRPEPNRKVGDMAEFPSALNRQADGGAEYPSELDRLVGGGTECQPELNRQGENRMECPPEPVWFLKPDTALLRNNDPFYIPSFSREVHYECELVVRIDRVGKGIAERFAHRYYHEVGLGIDFTARDLQRQAIAQGLPWERCKAFDRSAAISPEFVPLQQLGGDVQRLQFTLEVNGQTRQAGDTSEMRFTVDRIIAAVSRYMTLRMGDLIYTGTPAGVGAVQPGDNLRAVLEGRELLNFDIR